MTCEKARGRQNDGELDASHRQFSTLKLWQWMRVLATSTNEPFDKVSYDELLSKFFPAYSPFGTFRLSSDYDRRQKEVILPQ